MVLLSALPGSIVHGSKVPVRKWLFIFFEMCASKKGVSAREVERKDGLTAKMAWFVTQRIREGRLLPSTGTRWAPEAATHRWMDLAGAGKLSNAFRAVLDYAVPIRATWDQGREEEVDT